MQFSKEMLVFFLGSPNAAKGERPVEEKGRLAFGIQMIRRLDGEDKVWCILNGLCLLAC